MSASEDVLMALALGSAGGPDFMADQVHQIGQDELTHSDRLPVTIHFGTEQDFIDLGFSFGEPVDNLFRQATLPQGWKKKPANQPMWSYIVDTNGRNRVEVFYSSAFWDREAFMRLRSIDSEAWALVDGGPLIVDEWTTAERWVEVLTKLRDRELEEAALDDSDSEYAQRHRNRASICSRHIANLTEGSK